MVLWWVVSCCLLPYVVFLGLVLLADQAQLRGCWMHASRARLGFVETDFLNPFIFSPSSPPFLWCLARWCSQKDVMSELKITAEKECLLRFGVAPVLWFVSIYASDACDALFVFSLCLCDAFDKPATTEKKGMAYSFSGLVSSPHLATAAVVASNTTESRRLDSPQ